MRTLSLFTLLLLPHFMGLNNGTPAPKPVTTLQGIDVSHYQDFVAWDTIASEGLVDFAFVKATEGADHTDTLFEHNWVSLDRHGIRRGAYHFFRAYGCGYDQAMHFLSTVEMCPGDMPPVLDVEKTDGMPQEILLEEMRVWLQTVEQQLHVKPIIYTNQNFYERYLAGYFDNHPYWIARYSIEKPLLSTGKVWDFWQFTHTGTVRGVPALVDINLFNGTPQMLEDLCYRPAESVPAPAPEVNAAP